MSDVRCHVGSTLSDLVTQHTSWVADVHACLIRSSTTELSAGMSIRTECGCGRVSCSCRLQIRFLACCENMGWKRDHQNGCMDGWPLLPDPSVVFVGYLVPYVHQLRCTA